MPHHYPSHLVERQRVLSDLRTTLIPDPLPMVCRVCFTVQEDEGYHNRCLCKVPAWVPLDAVLHELNNLIRGVQEHHRQSELSVATEKVVEA